MDAFRYLGLYGSPDLRAEFSKSRDHESVRVELAEGGSHPLEDRSALFATKEAKAFRQFLIGHLGDAKMSNYLDEPYSKAIDVAREPGECRFIAFGTDGIPVIYEPR
jgi:hypothetical protein